MNILKYAALTFSIATASLALADKVEPNPNIQLATGKTEHCVGITRIDEIEVLDKRNILFYMKGKKVYLNDLPRPCPGFSSRDTITYSTSLHKLCNSDIVTELNDVGSDYMRGASCGLGKFYPISKEDADKLRTESHK
jgi:hypothetical protein